MTLQKIALMMCLASLVTWAVSTAMSNTVPAGHRLKRFPFWAALVVICSAGVSMFYAEKPIAYGWLGWWCVMAVMVLWEYLTNYRGITDVGDPTKLDYVLLFLAAVLTIAAGALLATQFILYLKSVG